MPLIKLLARIPKNVALLVVTGYNITGRTCIVQLISSIIDRGKSVRVERVVEMVPLLLGENILPKVAVLTKAIPVVRLGDTAIVIDEGVVDVDSTTAAVELQVSAEQCLFCGDVNFTACGHCHKYRKGN